MNAFVKKEMRLLLPGFLAGLPLVLLTWRQPEWGASSYSEKMAGLCLLFGAVLVLVMGTFGREFSSGTFSMLLSQPVSRIRIWGTKILILAAMTISLWAIWFAIRFVYHPSVNSAGKPARYRDFHVAVHTRALFGRALVGAVVQASDGGILVHGPASGGDLGRH